jgi:hypothetical protein
MIGGFAVQRLGDEVSGLLRNGDFVACVYRGLADDFAGRRIEALAAKIIKSGRKKFSRMTLKALDREISAWDYFCYARFTGLQSSTDKFITDFLRLALVKRLEDMPDAELQLLALTDIPIDAIDETTTIAPEAVFQRIHAAVIRLACEHGRTVAETPPEVELQ